jgi:hypothetical protein
MVCVDEMDCVGVAVVTGSDETETELPGAVAVADDDDWAKTGTARRARDGMSILATTSKAGHWSTRRYQLHMPLL